MIGVVFETFGECSEFLRTFASSAVNFDVSGRGARMSSCLDGFRT